ncbi:MAG: electron transport complex subunit RsxC [Steroidobacteraceae bacterium]|nr:electron transport complex subunit RsxC [Steroidobacteraceae bacterium]
MAATATRGLELAANKAAAAKPIRVAPPPALAVLALDQGSGHAATPVVRAGDRVCVGTLVAEARDPRATVLRAPVAGRVIALESRPTPPGDGPCLLIENDGSDEPDPVITPLDCARLAPEAIVAALRSAGVAGYGGGAFPTAAKLDEARAFPARHLLLNGAECEPWICCDDALMRARAGDVLDGARLLLRALDAARCTIAVLDDKPEARAALETALAGSPDVHISIVTVPARYPAGAERTLIEAVFGTAVPRGDRPPAAGILCHNVATAAAVAAVARGTPAVSRIVTVTGGGVASPANVEARLGTPIAELVALCGGYTGDPLRLIAGGSMTGRALATDAIPVTLGLNCVLVATRADLPDRGPERPCIRCGDCARVCPAGLLPQQLLAGLAAGDAAFVARHGLADCIECGCCDYVCPSAIPLTESFRVARAGARRAAGAQEFSDQLRNRYEAHLARLSAASETERQAFEAARAQARGRGP